MNARLLTTVFLGLAVFLGCGPTLQVKMDFDHAAAFTRYRSFQMGEGKVIEKGAPSENTIVQDRVAVAVRDGLVMRGLTPAPDGGDLIARFAVGARTVKELEAVGYPWGIGMWGAYPGDFWVTEYPEGTLVIDLVDARSQKLVWRAYCVAQGTGLADAAFIQKAVNKALEKFPPPRA
jgi:hypothetical protein